MDPGDLHVSISLKGQTLFPLHPADQALCTVIGALPFPALKFLLDLALG